MLVSASFSTHHNLSKTYARWLTVPAIHRSAMLVQMMAGKCYLRMGDKANARAWLEKAIANRVTDDAEAAKDQKEAEELLKKC